MFIPYEVFTIDCLGVRGLSTPGHVFPHRFQPFRLRLYFLCFLDFKRSDFVSIIFILDQVFRLRLCLRLPQIRRSNFAIIWIKCSDFICITFASTKVQTFRIILLKIIHLDFTFICIRCSDFIRITFSSIAVQMFRLHLLQIKRSDFAFVWIRCPDFICITFASTAVQTFRICLL